MLALKSGPQIAAKVGNPAGLLCRRIWYSVEKTGVLGITEYRQGRPLIWLRFGFRKFIICIPAILTAEWQARKGKEGSLRWQLSQSAQSICSLRVHRREKSLKFRSTFGNDSTWSHSPQLITRCQIDHIIHNNKNGLIGWNLIQFKHFRQEITTKSVRPMSSLTLAAILTVESVQFGSDKMDKCLDKWTCRRTSSLQHVTYPADKWWFGLISTPGRWNLENHWLYKHGWRDEYIIHMWSTTYKFYVSHTKQRKTLQISNRKRPGYTFKQV